MPDTTWIRKRLTEEVGLVEDDLLRLYGVTAAELDDYLISLGSSPAEVISRILSDLDAVRVGYRTVQVTDEQIATIRALLATCRFTPLISMETATHQIAWRLSGDDAQWVAYRASDVIGLDFEASDVLRLRLNRLAIWSGAEAPPFDDKFRDRVADVTFYLAELSGVL